MSLNEIIARKVRSDTGILTLTSRESIRLTTPRLQFESPSLMINGVSYSGGTTITDGSITESKLDAALKTKLNTSVFTSATTGGVTWMYPSDPAKRVVFLAANETPPSNALAGAVFFGGAAGDGLVLGSATAPSRNVRLSVTGGASVDYIQFADDSTGVQFKGHWDQIRGKPDLGGLAQLTEVATTNLANEAVTEAKIAASAVTAAKIRAGTITADLLDIPSVSAALAGQVAGVAPADAGHRDDPTSAISDGAITNAKISTNEEDKIRSNRLNVSDVRTAVLSAGSVGTTQLSDSAVATAKIADGAVTPAKLKMPEVADAVFATRTVQQTDLSTDLASSLYRPFDLSSTPGAITWRYSSNTNDRVAFVPPTAAMVATIPAAKSRVFVRGGLNLDTAYFHVDGDDETVLREFDGRGVKTDTLRCNTARVNNTLFDGSISSLAGYDSINQRISALEGGMEGGPITSIVVSRDDAYDTTMSAEITFPSAYKTTGDYAMGLDRVLVTVSGVQGSMTVVDRNSVTSGGASRLTQMSISGANKYKMGIVLTGLFTTSEGTITIAVGGPDRPIQAVDGITFFGGKTAVEVYRTNRPHDVIADVTDTPATDSTPQSVRLSFTPRRSDVSFYQLVPLDERLATHVFIRAFAPDGRQLYRFQRNYTRGLTSNTRYNDYTVSCTQNRFDFTITDLSVLNWARNTPVTSFDLVFDFVNADDNPLLVTSDQTARFELPKVTQSVTLTSATRLLVDQTNSAIARRTETLGNSSYLVSLKFNGVLDQTELSAEALKSLLTIEYRNSASYVAYDRGKWSVEPPAIEGDTIRFFLELLAGNNPQPLPAGFASSLRIVVKDTAETTLTADEGVKQIPDAGTIFAVASAGVISAALSETDIASAHREIAVFTPADFATSLQAEFRCTMSLGYLHADDELKDQYYELHYRNANREVIPATTLAPPEIVVSEQTDTFFVVTADVSPFYAAGYTQGSLFFRTTTPTAGNVPYIPPEASASFILPNLEADKIKSVTFLDRAASGYSGSADKETHSKVDVRVDFGGAVQETDIAALIGVHDPTATSNEYGYKLTKAFWFEYEYADASIRNSTLYLNAELKENHLDTPVDGAYYAIFTVTTWQTKGDVTFTPPANPVRIRATVNGGLLHAAADPAKTFRDMSGATLAMSIGEFMLNSDVTPLGQFQTSMRAVSNAPGQELLEFNHASWRSRITAIETNVAKTETVVTFAVLEGDPAALEVRLGQGTVTDAFGRKNETFPSRTPDSSLSMTVSPVPKKQFVFALDFDRYEQNKDQYPYTIPVTVQMRMTDGTTLTPPAPAATNSYGYLTFGDTDWSLTAVLEHGATSEQRTDVTARFKYVSGAGTETLHLDTRLGIASLPPRGYSATSNRLVLRPSLASGVVSQYSALTPFVGTEISFAPSSSAVIERFAASSTTVEKVTDTNYDFRLTATFPNPASLSGGATITENFNMCRSFRATNDQGQTLSVAYKPGSTVLSQDAKTVSAVYTVSPPTSSSDPSGATTVPFASDVIRFAYTLRSEFLTVSGDYTFFIVTAETATTLTVAGLATEIVVIAPTLAYAGPGNQLLLTLSSTSTIPSSVRNLLLQPLALGIGVVPAAIPLTDLAENPDGTWSCTVTPTRISSETTDPDGANAMLRHYRFALTSNGSIKDDKGISVQVNPFPTPALLFDPNLNPALTVTKTGDEVFRLQMNFTKCARFPTNLADVAAQAVTVESGSVVFGTASSLFRYPDDGAEQVYGHDTAIVVTHTAIGSATALFPKPLFPMTARYTEFVLFEEGEHGEPAGLYINIQLLDSGTGRTITSFPTAQTFLSNTIFVTDPTDSDLVSRLYGQYLSVVSSIEDKTFTVFVGAGFFRWIQLRLSDHTKFPTFQMTITNPASWLTDSKGFTVANPAYSTVIPSLVVLSDLVVSFSDYKLVVFDLLPEDTELSVTVFNADVEWTIVTLNEGSSTYKQTASCRANTTEHAGKWMIDVPFPLLPALVSSVLATSYTVTIPADTVTGPYLPGGATGKNVQAFPVYQKSPVTDFSTPGAATTSIRATFRDDQEGITMPLPIASIQREDDKNYSVTVVTSEIPKFVTKGVLTLNMDQGHTKSALTGIPAAPSALSFPMNRPEPLVPRFSIGELPFIRTPTEATFEDQELHARGRGRRRTGQGLHPQFVLAYGDLSVYGINTGTITATFPSDAVADSAGRGNLARSASTLFQLLATPLSFDIFPLEGAPPNLTTPATSGGFIIVDGEIYVEVQWNHPVKLAEHNDANTTANFGMDKLDIIFFPLDNNDYAGGLEAGLLPKNPASGPGAYDFVKVNEYTFRVRLSLTEWQILKSDLTPVLVTEGLLLFRVRAGESAYKMSYVSDPLNPGAPVVQTRTLQVSRNMRVVA
eukprot:jgi/Mesvir1/21156/Mv08918-RA.1